MELLELMSVGFKPKKTRDPVLKDLSFILNEKEFLGVFGNSQSNLKEFFQIIAGFKKPSEGVITLDDQVLADESFHLLPSERKIGIIPKELALFPHLSIEENIKVGLLGTESAKNIKLKELINQVGYEGDLSMMPGQISYFEQLQIAIARALTIDPVLLLLEEPFADISPSQRPKMHFHFKKIIQDTGLGLVFTTQLMEDALALSDKILVLNEGKLEQFDKTESVYKFPKNEFVMGLMQYTNCFAEIVSDGKIKTPFGDYDLENVENEKKVYWMVNPEELIITKSKTPIEAKIETSLYYGGHYQVRLETSFGILVARTTKTFKNDTTVYLAANAIDLIIPEDGKNED